MPQETALVIAAIVIPFIVFALVLAWSDYRARNLPNPQSIRIRDSKGD
jgi:multisubunit Na+/H+ antiporter MnhC subunit